MSEPVPLAKRQIHVEGYDFLDRSVEVARLWVQNGGPATCIIDPGLLREPELFGMLMVDTVRHAARAYAQRYGMTEDAALTRIWAGLEAERDRHTSPIKTIQNHGKLDS
ncbi:MAG: DUF5076 domain-containing protein [Erythrobacter sp.]|uniref:DUF5076 domain-containing protein n=1 Tax=Erythrobacter sp. TaxID=1042 RepID=UPI0025E0911F|nr:DUF5076 domain-containing protein [Erythrobacter sp.]MCL9997824.1 DUF5076 domain-containing protein [Erythrobacter sp.]